MLLSALCSHLALEDNRPAGVLLTCLGFSEGMLYGKRLIIQELSYVTSSFLETFNLIIGQVSLIVGTRLTWTAC